MSLFAVNKGDLMRRVLSLLNVRYPSHRRGWIPVSCPSDHHIHGDQHPSAAVNFTYGKFYCHGCGLRGDGFDLMRELRQVDAAEVNSMLDLVANSSDDQGGWVL